MHGPEENPVVVKDARNLKNYRGKKVVVEGATSNIPWQHLISGPPTHPKSLYFDIGDYQIVIYSKEDINCKGRLKVKGTVISLGGQEKRPDRKETATEYHIVVDDYECTE